VLLFVGAAGGSFVAARTLAGRSLVPPPKPSTTTPTTTSPTQTAPLNLVPIDGSAALTNGIDGGGFSISVPSGWQQFAEVRTAAFPGGAALHYVQPDGTEELTVEWYPKFFPNSSINDYLQNLRATWTAPGSLVFPAPGARIGGLQGGGPAPAQEVEYRTADGASPQQPAANAHRTTNADLFPDGDDLWVVSVTVVTDNEFAGKSLFDRIKVTFAPAS
jgi:hypothetical protein